MRTVLEHFIVFEGLDGAGTTTQTELLTESMRNSGMQVWATAEPTDGAVGRLIRAALRHEITLTPDTLAYLYAADRNQHLYDSCDGICDRVDDTWVISDRYLFSSLAYQSVQCDGDFVDTLNRSFPLPRWLFYVDVDPVQCAERRVGRGAAELFDAIEFQRAVYNNYDEILQRFSAEPAMQIVRIDGNRTVEAIAEQVWSALQFGPIQ